MPIPLGVLAVAGAGGAAASYWFGLFGTSFGDQIDGVWTDSSNNIYIVGRRGTSTNPQTMIVKLNVNGNILWQKTLEQTGTEYFNYVRLASSGNIYAVGSTNSIGAGNYDLLLAKYDSNGSLIWQKILGDANQQEGLYCITDSSENIYVSGYTTIGTVTQTLLAKYDSSGNLSWQRFNINNIANRLNIGSCLAFNNAGTEIIMFGRNNQNFRNNMIRYQTDGTHVANYYQNVFGVSGADGQTGIQDVRANSSDVFYLADNFLREGFTINDGIIKTNNLDMSGNLAATRLSGSGSPQVTFNGLDNIDSTNHIVIGQAGNDMHISRWSGTSLTWQRRITVGSGATVGVKVKIDSLGRMILAGRTTGAGAGANDGFVAVLPIDGSLTGTYTLSGQNIVYQASSLTATAASVNNNSYTEPLTNGTSTFTAANSTLTDTTSSLTTSKVTI